MNKERAAKVSIDLWRLLHWKPRFDPSPLPLGIMGNVGVTHRRQFTGGVFASVSMSVCAVCDNLNVLVGEQPRSDFLNPVWGNVQCAGKVGFAVTLRSKRLDDLNRILSVQLCLQVPG